MDIKEITQAIMFNGLTNDQLDQVSIAIRYARSQLTQQNRRALRVGDTVKFTSSRDGVTYKGDVTKIAIKYITVRTGNMLYRVPASMLEAI
jgi:small-conductance mechanosensitive channel